MQLFISVITGLPKKQDTTIRRAFREYRVPHFVVFFLLGGDKSRPWGAVDNGALGSNPVWVADTEASSAEYHRHWRSHRGRPLREGWARCHGDTRCIADKQIVSTWRTWCDHVAPPPTHIRWWQPVAMTCLFLFYAAAFSNTRPHNESNAGQFSLQLL